MYRPKLYTSQLTCSPSFPSSETKMGTTSFRVFLWFFTASLVIGAYEKRFDKGPIRFQVSGRHIHKSVWGSDPYCTVSFSDDGNIASDKEIGRTETLKDNENPDWGKKFEVEFDRKRHQYLHFVIRDDNYATKGDVLGSVWLTVVEFVDNDQLITKHTEGEGTIIIKSVDYNNLGPGKIPLPPPAPGDIRFRISFRNLSEFNEGLIPNGRNPYASVDYVSNSESTPVNIGRTTALPQTHNPKWKEVFNINYNGKPEDDLRLRIRIYDDDTHTGDKFMEEVWVSVADYVAKGENYTLPLEKEGTFHMQKLT